MGEAAATVNANAGAACSIVAWTVPFQAVPHSPRVPFANRKRSQISNRLIRHVVEYLQFRRHTFIPIENLDSFAVQCLLIPVVAPLIGIHEYASGQPQLSIRRASLNTSAPHARIAILHTLVTPSCAMNGSYLELVELGNRRN